MNKKHSNSLLLALFNLLADYDGQIPVEAVSILVELRQRSDCIPPLYADVVGLPSPATCAELVDRIHALSQQQLALASYAFQIFRSYEQMLRVDTTSVTPQQKAAYESQLDRIRRLVARTRTAIAEAIGEGSLE